jgi:hypothetical protein
MKTGPQNRPTGGSAKDRTAVDRSDSRTPEG